jgi:hypothetical protein
MSADGEVVQLLREIQTLALEVADGDGRDGAEVEAKKRTLEQLRWRLAIASRRTAQRDLGDAA